MLMQWITFHLFILTPVVVWLSYYRPQWFGFRLRLAYASSVFLTLFIPLAASF